LIFSLININLFIKIYVINYFITIFVSFKFNVSINKFILLI